MDKEQEQPVRRSRAESGAVAKPADLTPTWTDKDGVVHRKRILTGDRTTGKLHLGHYVGSLRNRVALQGKYDTFILMADVQALTTHWDRPEILKQSVMDVALDYLAIGLEPYTGGADDGSKVKIVIQSAVPSIAELTVLYGLVVPMSLILDNPTTKAEAQQHELNLDNIEREREDWNKLFGWTADSDIGKTEELMLIEFPELGVMSSADLMMGTQALFETSDVAVQHEIKHLYKQGYMNETLWKSKLLRRSLRDLILKQRKTAGVRQMSYGFLGYPVSQAADITFVGAHLVPVGEDQVPHIELTREIVRRMNKQYGGRRRILTEPQALVGGGGTLKALDGSAKMSKSLGNAVYLSDSDDAIWKQLKVAVTDPQRVRRDDPGRPEICNVFAYHQQFNEETEPAIKDAGLKVPSLPETAELCRTAGIGCVECKENLAKKLTALLDPIRERRAQWEQRPDDVLDILKAGTRRGNEDGNATVERVKAAMHVDYFGKQ